MYTKDGFSWWDLGLEPSYVVSRLETVKALGLRCIIGYYMLQWNNHYNYQYQK